MLGTYFLQIKKYLSISTLLYTIEQRRERW